VIAIAALSDPVLQRSMLVAKRRHSLPVVEHAAGKGRKPRQPVKRIERP